MPNKWGMKTFQTLINGGSNYAGDYLRGNVGLLKTLNREFLPFLRNQNSRKRVRLPTREFESPRDFFIVDGRETIHLCQKIAIFS